MSNLSNAMREKIIENAVIKSGAYAKRDANIKRLADWAELVRVKYFGSSEKAAQAEKELGRIIEALTAVAPWTTVSNAMSCQLLANLNGRGVSVRFSGHLSQRDEEKAKASKVYRLCPNERIVLREGDPLIPLFDVINRERLTLEEDRENLRATVKAALSNVRSVKQLLKVWPEAAELLPEEEKAVAGLPAIPVSQLNAKIGLPTGEAPSHDK